MNKIEPQATALFNTRFSELLHEAQREITNIKSECNARGLLNHPSSIPVQLIFEYIEKLVTNMAVLAEQCTVQAFEAGNFPVNDNLQSELLDSFELYFTSAYPKLVSLANSETSKMRQSLASGGLLEPGRLTNVANLAKLNAQANLRKYYQDQLKKKKKWYECWQPLVALIKMFNSH